MSIKVGDKLPEATFMEMTADGPQPRTTEQVFGGKTIALFAVPGAYTPTCSARHLPGFVDKSGALMPITPGMQAAVDIHTGERSVMTFLLKPFLRLKQEGFRER